MHRSDFKIITTTTTTTATTTISGSDKMRITKDFTATTTQKLTLFSDLVKECQVMVFYKVFSRVLLNDTNKVQL